MTKQRIYEIKRIDINCKTDKEHIFISRIKCNQEELYNLINAYCTEPYMDSCEIYKNSERLIDKIVVVLQNIKLCIETKYIIRRMVEKNEKEKDEKR